MSAGGVFKIIANDGKADKLIMATQLLNQRIQKIMCYRKARGLDPTPTLVDIERTNVLFVNAHFKPFVSLGYEYNKTRTNTGNPQFGSSVQFSIPQFGDFFNDMVIHTTITPVTTTVGTVPALPGFVGPSNQVLTSTYAQSGVENTATGVYTQYTHSYVNSAGVTLAVGSPASNFVQYAEYPGVRLFTKVAFDVNNNPLDNYTNEAVLFYMKFNVAINKRLGWNRLMGQEVPMDAHTDLLSIAGTSNYGSPATNLIDQNNNPVISSPVNALQTARKLVQIVSGHQTPKASHPALDLWIPLIFWFNLDVRLSIASVAIPYGQRFITITLDTYQNLVFLAPGDLYLQLVTEEQYSQTTNAGAGTPLAIGVQTVNKYITRTPVLATNSTIVAPTISDMTMYINNIFVNSEIHDIYIKRIGFTLIRLHLYQSNKESAASDNILMSQFKYPTEIIYVGIRPLYNISPSNPNQNRDWHRLTSMVDNYLSITSNSSATVMTDDTIAYNTSSLKHKISTTQQNVERIVYPTQVETCDTLQVQAQGITLWSQYVSAFYRDYISWRYGGYNINTPEDRGALIINFALFPGEYQPSGYMNISRAREFYIQYTSSYITPSTTAEFMALAIALNFLLISDGSAVIRYST